MCVDAKWCRPSPPYLRASTTCVCTAMRQAGKASTLRRVENIASRHWSVLPMFRRWKVNLSCNSMDCMEAPPSVYHSVLMSCLTTFLPEPKSIGALSSCLHASLSNASTIPLYHRLSVARGPKARGPARFGLAVRMFSNNSAESHYSDENKFGTDYSFFFLKPIPRFDFYRKIRCVR